MKHKLCAFQMSVALALLLLLACVRSDFQIGKISLDQIDEVSSIIFFPDTKYAVVAT